jgi:hypothetical protein
VLGAALEIIDAKAHLYFGSGATGRDDREEGAQLRSICCPALAMAPHIFVMPDSRISPYFLAFSGGAQAQEGGMMPLILL